MDARHERSYECVAMCATRMQSTARSGRLTEKKTDIFCDHTHYNGQPPQGAAPLAASCRVVEGVDIEDSSRFKASTKRQRVDRPTEQKKASHGEGGIDDPLYIYQTKLTPYSQTILEAPCCCGINTCNTNELAEGYL